MSGAAPATAGRWRRGLWVRRVGSWAGCAIALCVLHLAYTRLPGADGVGGELRWLLAPARSPRGLNRAGQLLRFREEREPGACRRLVTDLLAYRGGDHVRGLLRVISDLARDARTQGVCPPMQAWLARTTTEQRIALLPQSLLAAAACTACERSPEARDSPLAVRTSLPQQWQPPLNRDDRRWLVAATLERSEEAREVADVLVFRSTPADQRMTHRLRVLDGLTAFKSPDPVNPQHRLPPLRPDELAAQYRFDVAELYTFLTDPIPQVRWAAGRILTVCGDERGLQALRDWLVMRRIPPPAQSMLRDLFDGELP